MQVAGGSFPLFSRNLGFGEPTADAVRMTRAEHVVHALDLILPVMQS